MGSTPISLKIREKIGTNVWGSLFISESAHYFVKVFHNAEYYNPLWGFRNRKTNTFDANDCLHIICMDVSCMKRNLTKQYTCNIAIEGHCDKENSKLMVSGDDWKKISKNRQESKIETRKWPKYKNIYFQKSKKVLQK